jgi:hypothetical protein
MNYCVNDCKHFSLLFQDKESSMPSPPSQNTCICSFIQIILLVLLHILENYIFEEIVSFHLGHQSCGHTIAHYISLLSF